MKYNCPKCKRILYDRRLKRCGFCGATIPEELRFTPEEIKALDAKRELAETGARSAAARTQSFDYISVPIIYS